MKVRVEFYSRLRDATGVEHTEAEVREGATVVDLLDQLHASFPGLRGWSAPLLFAAGLEFVGRTHVLRECETVSIMPPVQGG